MADHRPAIVDPYTTVAAALWMILEADADFVAIVKPGNRIKFMGLARDPIKEQVSGADLPEVRIVVSSSSPHQKGSSNMTTDRVTFEIQVSSGDQRIDKWHLPLKWIVFKAMARARMKWTQLGTQIKWNGGRFISEVKAATATEGVSQTDLNRGIMGWSAVWAVEVEMFFALSDL